MYIYLPLVALEADSAVPLYEQLYLAIRRHILDGRVVAGARLASTRRLAEHLDVSRFTVVTALERLLAEGYLTTRVGSGTYVADSIPEQSIRSHIVSPPVTRSTTVSPALAKRGEVMSATWTTGPRPDEPSAFQPRRAPLDCFPVRAWATIVRRLWRDAGYRLLEYGDPAGYRPLREAIAAHLRETRAVHCDPDQVIVTSGSQQAFDLLFRLLLDPGDRAWIEEPGPLDVRAALAAAGATLVPVRVDKEGLDVSAGIAAAPDARLAVVSPSHQYPMGVTLSATRRLQIVQWAQSTGAWIVEDDYDCHFRFTGRPMSALQGIAASRGAASQVIYVGSFSKTMFPALRIGFCVAPPTLVRPLANARAVADRHSPTIDQAALAELIASGQYERHLRRLRMVCHERYRAMRTHCARVLGDRLSLSSVTAGTHVLGVFPRSRARRDRGLAERVSTMASDAGLIAFPLSRYCLERPTTDALVLGFGGLTPRRIGAAVERFAPIIDACK